MVTIGMNYEVLPGKNEVFERAFNQVLEAMKSMKGHKNSYLYKQVGDGDSYLILSDWDDEQEFTNFVRSESFAKVTNWGKEQILRARPKHQIYKSS